MCENETMEDGYVETKVEALQDNRVKVTVTVDAKEIDDRIKKTYKDFAYKYNFPGFRRGKAPRPVIDNALGAEAVRATVTDAVVNETYPLVVDENDLYPTGKPEFEDGGLVESGKPYAFEFTLAVKPELELSSYEAVEVELPAEGATDAEVDEQVEACASTTTPSRTRARPRRSRKAALPTWPSRPPTTPARPSRAFRASRASTASARACSPRRSTRSSWA